MPRNQQNRDGLLELEHEKARVKEKMGQDSQDFHPEDGERRFEGSSGLGTVGAEIQMDVCWWKLEGWHLHSGWH